MRFLLCSVLLLAACSDEPAGLPTGLFAGEGRDALCIAGAPGEQRAGFIAYGEGDINCSARGKVVAVGKAFALVPQGEGDCQIPLNAGDGVVNLGSAPAACAYYCGPDARFEGKAFRRVDPSDAATARSNPTTDLAGDPLC